MTCVAWVGSVAGVPLACCRNDVAEIDGMLLCATHRADLAAGRIVTPIGAVRTARVVGVAAAVQAGLFGGGV